MDAAHSHPQYITDEMGNKTAFILPIDAFTQLLDNLSDLMAVADRRNEVTISHKELLESLKADDLL